MISLTMMENSWSKEVEDFKYLGSNKRGAEIDAKKRIGKSRVAFIQLDKI